VTDALEFRTRLVAVRERIARAAERAGRAPEAITLVGVSKRKAVMDIARAVEAGLTHVGENYVQEAIEKLPQVLEELPSAIPQPRWHFIGQLQRNKARDVARHFDVVETVDRESLGRELDRRAAAAERRLDVLLQVNLSGEPQKGGAPPEAVETLLAASEAWDRLQVVGLMTVPENARSAEDSRKTFRTLRELRDTLQTAPGGMNLRELSMGMSRDFEIAIEEGATIVRVGTAIFGARNTGD